MELYRKIKKQQIVLDRPDHDLCIVGNPDILKISIREILINSFKYSPEESNIHITNHRSGNSFSLLFKNDILPMKGAISGIPEMYETSILKPFFRINNMFDDRFMDEDLSLGNGLVVVNNLLGKINAKFYIYELKNTPAGQEETTQICAEIIFPLTGE